MKNVDEIVRVLYGSTQEVLKVLSLLVTPVGKTASVFINGFLFEYDGIDIYVYTPEVYDGDPVIYAKLLSNLLTTLNFNFQTKRVFKKLMICVASEPMFNSTSGVALPPSSVVLTGEITLLWLWRQLRDMKHDHELYNPLWTLINRTTDLSKSSISEIAKSCLNKSKFNNDMYEVELSDNWMIESLSSKREYDSTVFGAWVNLYRASLDYPDLEIRDWKLGGNEDVLLDVVELTGLVFDGNCHVPERSLRLCKMILVFLYAIDLDRLGKDGNVHHGKIGETTVEISEKKGIVITTNLDLDMSTFSELRNIIEMVWGKSFEISVLKDGICKTSNYTCTKEDVHKLGGAIFGSARNLTFSKDETLPLILDVSAWLAAWGIKDEFTKQRDSVGGKYYVYSPYEECPAVERNAVDFNGVHCIINQKDLTDEHMNLIDYTIANIFPDAVELHSTYPQKDGDVRYIR